MKQLILHLVKVEEERMPRSETRILRRHNSLMTKSKMNKIRTPMMTLSPRVEIKGEERIRTSELPMRLVMMTAIITLACLLQKKVRMAPKILLTSNTAEDVVVIGPKQLQLHQSLHLGRSPYQEMHMPLPRRKGMGQPILVNKAEVAVGVEEIDAAAPEVAMTSMKRLELKLPQR